MATETMSKAAPTSKQENADAGANAKNNIPSREEQRQEASKAAKKALELQKQARELTQAAAGAGDPEERQKLLNEALNRSIEAESFGKTAKYLQSGAFQGFLAGGGMGAGVGVSLGTLTGSIVGGLTSVIFGGLGSGIGGAVGAIHGPWFKPGDALASGIRKITGDWPGWKATNMQKYQLEKMIGQVNEQERPSEADLEAMTVGDGLDGKLKDIPIVGQDGLWTETAKSYVPSAPWAKKEKTPSEVKSSLQRASNDKSRQNKGRAGKPTSPTSRRPTSETAQPKPSSTPTEDQMDIDTQDQQTTSNEPATARGRDTPASGNDKRSSSTQSQPTEVKKKPRKLESRQPQTAPASDTKAPERRKPKKLETRKPETSTTDSRAKDSQATTPSNAAGQGEVAKRHAASATSSRRPSRQTASKSRG
ncbi:hypothetical protein CAC42_4552 [Sphaceloma murrayae]|uniref:Uncharacterized protein n=1 Tax=Sphaceloma murrayae TaxID=2082308 RepID=A0A2K1QME0_9PEZI|nr:hypothetical protein CAC42_4552 [Sphaceloma murrayae]